MGGSAKYYLKLAEGVRHCDSGAIGPGLSEVEEASNQSLVDIDTQEQCCLRNKFCLPPPQHRAGKFTHFFVFAYYTSTKEDLRNGTSDSLREMLVM
jgi:hypothetical protein